MPVQIHSNLQTLSLIVCFREGCTDFEAFIVALFSRLVYILRSASGVLRKPHLNMLREATVAQAPGARFDPHRSEGL